MLWWHNLVVWLRRPKKLDLILALLVEVAERVANMPTLTDFQTAVAGINSDLDTITTLLQSNTGGLSAADTQAALDLVNGVKSRTASLIPPTP